MNRSLAQLFIVYDEKRGQNCLRFGTRRLDGKLCLIPHIHSHKVCREDQVLKAEDEARGFQHFSPGLANVIMFLTSFDLHSQSTHNVWSEVSKTEGEA